MALFSRPQLYDRVNQELRKSVGFEFPQNKANQILNETKREQRLFSEKRYDIFLSHSSNDKVEVIGLKLVLEDLGYSVYVDWINDPELNRSNVSKENAGVLRERMKSCSTLLYAFSENAASSSWMPWELGYFDGKIGFVAVLPISREIRRSEFKGNEFVGLYPYIDMASIGNTVTQDIWVNESSDVYVRFRDWIGGRKPFKRRA